MFKKNFFKEFVIFEIILKIFDLKDMRLATKIVVNSYLKIFFFEKFVSF